VRITKRVDPGKRIWVGKCQSCGSEAEAEEAELTGIVHDQPDGSLSWEKCPVCGGYGGMCFHPKGEIVQEGESNE